MRVVADTNTVVSGLLWRGPPREVLDYTRQGLIQLFTSSILLLELRNVLEREKFADRLKLGGAAAGELQSGYAALAEVTGPSEFPRVVRRDPDDDAVVACAVAARANVIVTGDNDLLVVRGYRSIEIVTANELLLRLRRTTR